MDNSCNEKLNFNSILFLGDSKKGSKEKETKGSKKGEVVEEVVQSESPESRSPLFDAIKKGDQWLLPGNSALVFLGLSCECGCDGMV